MARAHSPAWPVWLLLAQRLGWCAAGSPIAAEVELPTVALADLLSLSPAAINTAHKAFKNLGALAVTGAHEGQPELPGHDRNAQASLKHWAQCVEAGALGRQDALIRPLAHGAVRRVSMTSGGRWGSPPTAFAQCSSDGVATKQAQAARSSLRAATRAVLAALDAQRREDPRHPMGLGGVSILRKAGDGSHVGASLVDVVDQGQHLEHFHLYEEVQNRSSFGEGEALLALDLHTDAGLLLAFLPPAMDESSSGPSRGALYVAAPDGEVMALPPLPEDAVIFFVGEGAMMLRPVGGGSRLPWRPLPHSLLLNRGFSWRAWYGAMVLPPHDALLRRDGPVGPENETATTFGAFWNSAQRQVSVGGDGAGVEPVLPTVGSGVSCGRGLLAMDPMAACPTGQLNCWMTCQSTAGLEQCHGGTWVSEGAGDLAKWANFSIQCRDPKGKKWPEETSSMCPTCKPRCTLTDDITKGGGGGGVSQSDFCLVEPNSLGSVMYMDGFRWTIASRSEPCLAFLIPVLVIDRPWKFVLACAVVVAISASIELVNAVQYRLPRKHQRHAGLLLRLLSLSLAYLAMLFVMMYSAEIFLCVLAGLLLGHILARPLSKNANFGPQSPCCRPDCPMDTEVGEPTQLMQLRVSGMSCVACTDTVRQALMAVNGVSQVMVDREKACAVVVCRGAPVVTAAELTAVLDSVGFPATELPAGPAPLAPAASLSSRTSREEPLLSAPAA